MGRSLSPAARSFIAAAEEHIADDGSRASCEARPTTRDIPHNPLRADPVAAAAYIARE
jgi:hypothetical protein